MHQSVMTKSTCHHHLPIDKCPPVGKKIAEHIKKDSYQETSGESKLKREDKRYSNR